MNRTEQRITASLDQSLERVDQSIVDRLDRQRRALSAEQSRPAWQPTLAFAAVAASACVAAYFMAANQGEHGTLAEPPPTPPVALENIDLELLESEDFEMLQDLEFYVWLEESDVEPGDAG